MLVLADHTPLRSLILLGYVDILPALYGRVIIPQAVFTELQNCPASLAGWHTSCSAYAEEVAAGGGFMVCTTSAPRAAVLTRMCGALQGAAHLGKT